ncbi:MAG: hypothetical protein JOZ22_06880 [Acidobacteriia bacterium]|nr:hypothetical protein [Terriglobia bacterium]
MPGPRKPNVNVDLNLDTLKREILDTLEASGFAIFRGSPGGLEGLPMVLWDVEHYPDYQMFLETARKTGAKLLIFATREFAASDIDELLEQLEDSDLSREEQRDYDRRLREMRIFEGVTCSIEIAFDCSSRLYVYEVQPDWYEEFLNLEEEIHSRFDENDLDDSNPLGGYFSKN